MSESLLGQSFNITLIGMSVVFVFLLILVALMYLMSFLVKVSEKYFPQTVAQAAAGSDNTLVAIAIAAAKRFQTK